MPTAPLILVSPDIESVGKEHQDRSISLSARYAEALSEAGALPLAMPPTISRKLISQCVARADGILLTGGDDVDPRLYNGRLPGHVSKTVSVTPDSGERDL